MIDLVDEVHSIISFDNTPRNIDTFSFSRSSSKVKDQAFSHDDCADEVSTVASSNFCSETFEHCETLLAKKSFDDAYERIEKFFEEKGFIVICPDISCNDAKRCVELSDFSVLCQGSEGLDKKKVQSELHLSLLVEKPSQKSPVPSFLAKRVASQGAQGAENLPKQMTSSGFKPGSKLSYLCMNKSTLL